MGNDVRVRKEDPMTDAKSMRAEMIAGGWKPDDVTILAIVDLTVRRLVDASVAFHLQAKNVDRPDAAKYGSFPDGSPKHAPELYMAQSIKTAIDIGVGEDVVGQLVHGRAHDVGRARIDLGCPEAVVDELGDLLADPGRTGPPALDEIEGPFTAAAAAAAAALVTAMTAELGYEAFAARCIASGKSIEQARVEYCADLRKKNGELTATVARLETVIAEYKALPGFDPDKGVASTSFAKLTEQQRKTVTEYCARTPGADQERIAAGMLAKK